MSTQQIEQELRNVSMGDESGIAAIASRLNASSPDALAAAVSERVKFTQAAEQFCEEYGDLRQDSKLWSLVVSRDAELARQHPEMDYRERLRLAGEEIRRWNAAGRGGSADGPKRNPPARGPGRRAVAAPDESTEPPDTESADGVAQILADMASKRRPGGRPIFHPFREGDHDPYGNE